MAEITFKTKPRPIPVQDTFLYERGSVTSGNVKYPARRNRFTGAVQVNLTICGWSTINESDLFVLGDRIPKKQFVLTANEK